MPFSTSSQIPDLLLGYINWVAFPKDKLIEKPLNDHKYDIEVGAIIRAPSANIFLLNKTV